ncbi:MAG: DUF721 domain-containing protein [Spirochaetes bacterium]|nr:DUF721 domain-containing protein [Spirochaetota bacterium]
MSSNEPGRGGRPEFRTPADFARQFEARYREMAGAASAVAFWRKAVGPVIARQTRAKSLKNGVLTVAVHDPAWMAELGLERGRLLARYQAELPAAGVQEIRLFLERAAPGFDPSAYKPPPSFSLAGIPEPELPPLAPLADDALHASLERLRRTTKRIERWRELHAGEDPWATPVIPPTPKVSDAPFFFPESGVVSDFLDPGDG